MTGALLALALRSVTARRCHRRALLVAVLACPASAINAIDGQAVFLVAALIVGGFGLLERRPYLGGLVLGLLTFKPQFCILVPIALIAAGQWRALLASGVSALAMMIASGLIFGWDLWLRWFPLIIENLVSPSEKWIEFGRMWGHSVYTCAVLLGAPATAGVVDSTARHARRRRIRRHRVPIAAGDAGKDGGLSGRHGPRRAAFRTL